MDVQAEAGAAGRAVDVSYDAGRTWRTATIKASGTRHLLILRHRITAEHVAFRAHLVDRDGNTAIQTRINAYALTTPSHLRTRPAQRAATRTEPPPGPNRHGGVSPPTTTTRRWPA